MVLRCTSEISKKIEHIQAEDDRNENSIKIQYC